MQVMDRSAALTAQAEQNALEQRAEIESLEQLHHERRRLGVQRDRLAALHGPFGLYDERRRQLRGAILTRIRQSFLDKNEKVPAAEVLESMACADPEYVRALDTALNEKIEYIRLETTLSEINERIRNREISLRAWTAEIQLR